MKELGREDDLEKINRIALKLAKEVAVETGTLMAGGMCSSKIYEEGNEENHKIVRGLFQDQVIKCLLRMKTGILGALKYVLHVVHPD